MLLDYYINARIEDHIRESGPLFVLPDGTEIDLWEAWKTKGKHLSAAHRKAISDALKKLGGTKPIVPKATSHQVKDGGANVGKAALVKKHPVGTKVKVGGVEHEVTGHTTGYLATSGGKKKWIKITELDDEPKGKVAKKLPGAPLTATHKTKSAATPKTAAITRPREVVKVDLADLDAGEKAFNKSLKKIMDGDETVRQMNLRGEIRRKLWAEIHEQEVEAGRATKHVGPSTTAEDMQSKWYAAKADKPPEFTKPGSAYSGMGTKKWAPKDTGTHADPSFHEYWNTRAAVLSPAERAGIRNYAGDDFGYQRINTNLRKGKTELPGDAKNGWSSNDVANIDSALKSSRTDRDMTVFRGLKSDVNTDFSKLVGYTITDKGYGSTSVTPGAAFSGDTIMSITVPKGSRGMYVQSLNNKNEPEFILPRGYSLKITKAEKQGKVTHVVAELVGDSAPDAKPSTGSADSLAKVELKQTRVTADEVADLPKRRAMFAEAEAERKQADATYKDKLSDDQYQALRKYRGAGYEDMNGHLRTGEPKDDYTKKMVTDLDSAFDAGHYSLSKDTLMYRGVKGDFADSMKPGMSFTDKGYVSASVDEGVGHFFSATGTKPGAVVMFKAPAGQNVLPGTNGEFEYVLPRNQKFRIESVHDKMNLDEDGSIYPTRVAVAVLES